MSSNYDRPTPPRSPKEELLGELESIKGLLEDEMDLDIDIPILSDVVTTDSGEGEPSNLLDLRSIFEDDELLTETSTAPHSVEVASIAEQPSELSVTPETEAIIADSSFEDLESASIDDFNLDALNLDELDLEDLDASITMPDFKLSTALSNHQKAEDADAGPNDSAEAPASSEPDLLAMMGISTDEPSSEEQEDMFPELSTPATHSAIKTKALSPMDMELLIQEIVDEFIPTIEDALRQRLTECAPEVIKQLADKHLQR